MIFDKISNFTFYSDAPDLGLVLKYLASVDKEHMPDATVILNEDRAFVNPVRFTSKEESEGIFEAHRKYADVHFIVEGEEKVYVKDIHDVSEKVPYSDEKDIGFYDATGGISIVLHPGEFLVCYPQDAHKVALAPSTPAPVVKLVGKVRV